MTKEHFLKYHDIWLRAAKGEQLQARHAPHKFEDVSWRIDSEMPDHINVNDIRYEWRIKPEPRKFKITISKEQPNTIQHPVGIYHVEPYWEIIEVTEDVKT